MLKKTKGNQRLKRIAREENEKIDNMLGFFYCQKQVTDKKGARRKCGTIFEHHVKSFRQSCIYCPEQEDVDFSTWNCAFQMKRKDPLYYRFREDDDSSIVFQNHNDSI